MVGRECVCVLFLRQSGGPPLWVSPLGVPFEDLRDSGFVPLRGLDFEHFVHGILSKGLDRKSVV